MSEGTSFNNYLIERLRDPLIACNYITEAIDENDSEYLKVALGDVVKAYGVGEISEKSGLNRQTIYKMLSEDGDPTHKNLVAILNAIGLELTVKPKKTAAS
jgi:probable addiction module antidote protein